MPAESDHIKGALIITAAAALFAFIINLFHPGGYRFVSKKSSARQLVFISSEEAKIKLDKGSAIFIDSRTGDLYRKAHIQGALNIPVFPEAAYTGGIKKSFNRLQESLEIVIYCDGETCGTSRELAGRLIKMGYGRHLYIIKDGFPAWEKAGFPVDR